MNASLSGIRELTTDDLEAASGGKNIVFGIGGGVTIVIQTGYRPVPTIWVCGPNQCVDTGHPH